MDCFWRAEEITFQDVKHWTTLTERATFYKTYNGVFAASDGIVLENRGQGYDGVQLSKLVLLTVFNYDGKYPCETYSLLIDTLIKEEKPNYLKQSIIILV